MTCKRLRIAASAGILLGFTVLLVGGLYFDAIERDELGSLVAVATATILPSLILLGSGSGKGSCSR